MHGVVLVHGAWHGGWCWDKVVTGLARRGLTDVVAVDLPLTSMGDDIAATRRAVENLADSTGGPVVLAGHSYGGTVVSAASSGAPVSHLVFVSALASAAGESALDTAALAGGSEDVSIAMVDEQGRIVAVPDEAVARLYSDCDPAEAAAAVAKLRPMAASCTTTVIDAVGWESISSTYIHCEFDAAVTPPLQELLAARAGSEVVKVASAHSPFLSCPDDLVGVIFNLASR